MDEITERIIANTLSNIYDWESEDLKTDFIEFITCECVIDNQKLSNLFDEFNKLSPKVRDHITFDVNAFIKAKLN